MAKIIVKARRSIRTEQTAKFELDVPDYLVNRFETIDTVVSAYLAKHADDVKWETGSTEIGGARGTGYTDDPDEPLPPYRSE